MASNKLDAQGIAFALASTATWATAGIFIRWLPGWSSFAILSGRFLIATIALTPIVLSSRMRPELFRSLRTPAIWGLSLPMIGGYLLGTTAFQLAPVGEVTLLISTSPIFVAAYKVCSKIHISRSEGIGTLLATVGVGLILFPQLSADRGLSWQGSVGHFFALSTAVLLAMYVLLLGYFARNGKTFRSVNLVFTACLLGCGLSFLCLLVFSGPAEASSFTQQTALVILGLGIFSTATSTLLYTIAVQRLPPLLTSALLLTEPIFAVLFASVLLKEIPSVWFGIGSLFVLSGLLSVANGARSQA